MNPAAANKVAELIACSDDPGESFCSAENALIVSQCCGSMKFWYGCGSETFNKIFFSSKYFCLLLFEGTFMYIIFQRKKAKEVAKK
jgi:hypothetical protein